MCKDRALCSILYVCDFLFLCHSKFKKLSQITYLLFVLRVICFSHSRSNLQVRNTNILFLQYMWLTCEVLYINWFKRLFLTHNNQKLHNKIILQPYHRLGFGNINNFFCAHTTTEQNQFCNTGIVLPQTTVSISKCSHFPFFLAFLSWKGGITEQHSWNQNPLHSFVSRSLILHNPWRRHVAFPELPSQ